jgi:transposase-like protein
MIQETREVKMIHVVNRNETKETTKGVMELKHYSTKELARFYGVCDKTLLKWMKPFQIAIGQKQGRYFTVAQVKVIFEKLGIPGTTES